MSKRLNYLLGVALVVQLLVAAMLVWSGGDFGAITPESPLLQFDRARIDRVVIESPGQGPVVLVKQGGTWRLPELHNFQAVDAKVEALLTSLKGLKKRLPIAASAGASARFKVAPEGFEHRVRLDAGEREEAALYLGSSPGFRRLYARAEGEASVYEIEFAPHIASANSQDWADKGLLAVPRGKIARLSLNDVDLVLEQGIWRLAGSGEIPALDQAKVRKAVDKLVELRFLTLLGVEDRSEYHLVQPALQFDVGLTDGTTVAYRIGKPVEGNDYVLKTSAQPFYVSLADYAVEDLKKISRASLLPEPVENATPSVTPATGSTASDSAAPPPSSEIGADPSPLTQP